MCYRQGDGAIIEFDLEYYNKSVKIRHDGGHYYHKRSFKIISDNLTEKQENRLKEKIITINKKLADYGYEFIECDRTAQAIEQLNNYEFYENGDIC